MAYQYRRTNSPDEKAARDEVNNRVGAVKQAREYLQRHPKYGGIEGNVPFLSDEVIRLGLGRDEITTERLNELLSTVEHRMAVRPEYTEAWRIFQQAWPQLLINESVTRGFTNLYRQEYPHDRVMDPTRLIGLVKNPWAKRRGLIQSNGTWEAEQAQQAAQRAEVASSGRMIAEMTSEYYNEDGTIKGDKVWDKQRIQQRADEDVAFLTSLNIADLTARYNGWKEQNRMLAADSSELKAEIRAKEARRITKLTQQFEPLPEFYENPDGTKEPWTKKLFLRFGNEPGPDGESRLKYMVRRYGAPQINAVLGQ